MEAIKTLRNIIFYDHKTGKFTWLSRTPDMFEFSSGRTQEAKCMAFNSYKAGKPAGSLNKAGYVQIQINKRNCLAHRIAWIYHYGHAPTGQIDHINCDKTDNRIFNLRIATPSENSRNQIGKSTNTSGYKGVSWNKQMKKWLAQICSNNIAKHIGYFDTKENAYAAYCEYAKHLHGEFARVS